MLYEAIASAKSIEEATELACEQLGKSKEEVQIEVLDEPKIGLFGKVKVEARVRAFYEEEERLDKAGAAKQYITDVLHAMGLSNFEIETTETEEQIVLNIEGEGLGVIIGRRGETLDAIQYLTSLVANRLGGEYTRITIDSGDYRSKREQTLKQLAQKLARTVAKTGRSSTLEPMNPYERRVIHSVVSKCEGVVSKSIGEEPNRRVVISSTNPKKGSDRNGERRGRKNNGRNYHKRDEDVELKSMNLSKVGQTSFEAEYMKSEKPERERQAKLYEKIEL